MSHDAYRGEVIAHSPRHDRASRAIPLVLAVAVVGVACWDRWSERIAASAAAELEGRAPTPSELVPSVEAAFARESYPPGATATLVISNRGQDLRLQILRSAPSAS